MAAAKPRIAIVADTAPPTSGGGVGVAHYNLFRALRDLGFDAELFVFFERAHLSLAEDQSQEAVHRFGPTAHQLKLLLQLNKWLFRLLAPGKLAWNTVDIFASWPGMQKLNRALADFAPDVIILPDHGAPALWLKAPPHAQKILIAHHNPMRLASMDFETYSELDARWAVTLEQKTLHQIDKVACPSHHMHEWFTRTYKFSGPVEVIPNVVVREDLEQVAAMDLRPQLGLSPDSPLICVPSAQTVVKGSRILPEILAQICTEFAAPIGIFIPGELDPQLEQSLPTLPENIRLYAPGRLAWQEYIAFLKKCSLGLFLSMRDNYSMALVEAAVCGVPMLAFNAGGNADIVQHKVNGILVEGESPAIAAEAIALLRNPRQLQQLQSSTQADAQQRFDSRRVVQQYLGFMGVDG